MPNEATINFLTAKITGLEIIKHELSRIFLNISDLDEADAVRREITRLNQLLFTLQSIRNSLAATANEVPPPSEEQVAALTDALRRLDGFVSSDQNIRTALNFLTQVATVIRNV
jgi:Mg2+ and Co2+ transporter CorA